MKPEQPSGQCCKNCRFFEPDTADEVDPDVGYCTRVFVEDDKWSEHYEYGGFWTNEKSWCARWKAEQSA